MKKTVVAFGEVLWDILPSCTVLGGAPFNFAYRIHSLGDAGLMVSRLGRDDLGRQAFDKVAALGLDTSLLQWDDEAPTGTVQVSFDPANNPDYIIIPHVAYDRIDFTDALGDAATNADCLCFGTLAQRAPQSRATLERMLDETSALKLLDINLRKKCYNEQSIRFSLGQADVLKLNEDEAHALGDMLGISHDTLPHFCADVVRQWDLRYCLVTLGEMGAFGVSANGEKTYAPGYQVDLVDSLGSGDAFSAGFVWQVLRGAALAEAVGFGNVLGAIVATQTGATAPIATAEFEAFTDGHLERNVHAESDEMCRGAQGD
jgi:fructokinase